MKNRVLSPFAYAVWIVSFLLEIATVVCTLRRKDFLRYISVNLYMLTAAGVNCAEYVCVSRYGISSKEYYFCYYYTEGLLTILMFFVIIQFYRQVFAAMNVSRYIRSAASLLLGGTALFSYLVVHQGRAHLTNAFVIEIGQNLYFVGVVLTYVLWGTILKLGETRTRLVHLVLALGIYFSVTAALYALRNLFPALEAPILHWFTALPGTWLPLAWAYTFIRVPEDARFVMARLAVKTR